MAANNGAKFMRDFFRESPCRMAYAMSQRKALGPQPIRNQNLRKIFPKKTVVVRPQTAPVLIANLAQPVPPRSLDGVGSRQRPTTSVKPVHTALGGQPDGRRSPRCSSVDSVPRKSPISGVRKQTKPLGLGKKPPPTQPCNISVKDTDPAFTNLWQDLLNDGLSRKRTDNIGNLNSKIDAIRSEHLSEDGGLKHVTFGNTIQKINAVKNRIPSSSRGRVQVARPQTERLAHTSFGLGSRKSVKKLPFEGGRFVGAKSTTGEVDDAKPSRSKTKCTAKQSKKKFTEGPIRTMFALTQNSTQQQKRFQF